MFQKVKVQPYEQGSPESEYSKLLTTYASTFVIKQLKLADKVKVIKEDAENYVVDTSEGEKIVSLTGCGCIFHKSMLLPCRHVFALRTKLGESLFESICCDKRCIDICLLQVHPTSFFKVHPPILLLLLWKPLQTTNVS